MEYPLSQLLAANRPVGYSPYEQLQRQASPPPAVGPTEGPPVMNGALSALLERVASPTLINGLQYHGNPQVSMMPVQRPPTGAPSVRPADLIPGIEPPMPESIPGFPEAIPRDYDPYYMAPRQAAASPAAPWMPAAEDGRTPNPMAAAYAVERQSAGMPDIPAPTAPEREYEDSHRGRMERKFFEGADPSTQASVMQMHAMANLANDDLDAGGDQRTRYDKRTGKWRTETPNRKQEYTQNGLVPLTEKQQANRAARDKRMEDFYAQRKQDAQLEGLPPLTRFIAKQMGGEGGINPLLLATASPGLGQMAMQQQQSEARNELQRDLAEGQNEVARDGYTNQATIAGLNNQSHLWNAIVNGTMGYLTQMGVSPATALPVFGQIADSIQSGQVGMQQNPSQGEGTGQLPRTQPGPLSQTLTNISNSTGAQSLNLPATETIQDAINLVANNPAFDLDTPEGLQRARAFLQERGFGRQQLHELRSNSIPTWAGDLQRDWRATLDPEAWSTWWDGATTSQAHRDRAELERMAALAAKLIGE